MINTNSNTLSKRQKEIISKMRILSPKKAISALKFSRTY